MHKATALAFLLAAPALAQQAPEKIALTVEYVGMPASDRGRDFIAFLKQHFETVDSTYGKTIRSPEEAVAAFDNADVLVIDTNLAGRLPAGYGKPMVVLSGPGVQTAEGLGAKLDWL